MSETLHICNFTVARCHKLRTMLPVPGTEIGIPLTIINGRQDGPALLLTAGIHGGEYPGIAAAIELGSELQPEEISGCLIILHPVNIQGFWARREFMVPEDGKNLNRVFPGNPQGTLSDKIAYFLSSQIFPLADFYVDMHSGDIHETLHPYVYYPGQPTPEIEAKSRSMAQVLDLEYMVRSLASGGAYNYAASTGLPSILIERGGAGTCFAEDIAAYKKDILNIMRKLNMLASPLQQRRHFPQDVDNVIYLQAPENGCWRTDIRCGMLIEKGQSLGRLTDVFGKVIAAFDAQQSGIVLYNCQALAAPKGSILAAYGSIRNNE